MIAPPFKFVCVIKEGQGARVWRMFITFHAIKLLREF